jgi:tetratricopeptide (TPR) repeat protein
VLVRFGLIVGLLFAILVTYFASLNPTRAHISLGGDWAFDVPVMALVAVVFVAGAALASAVGGLRDITRTYRRRARPVRPAPVLATAAAEGTARPHQEPVRDHAERDELVDRRRWAGALEVQTRLIQETPRERRPAEETILAGLHYEVARDRLERNERTAAVSHLKEALRLQPDFVPAALLLGDTHLKAGESREALRVWERAAEASQSALPLLGRIEHLYRTEGRPTRMISLYQEALARHPDNQALAFGLGRVYFELAMLDEAAEQFQKMEVRATDLPQIHAYLGAILERRGQFRDAMEEYRRALRLSDSVEWPHRCAGCGAVHSRWIDRCPTCRRWNSFRP